MINDYFVCPKWNSGCIETDHTLVGNGSKILTYKWLRLWYHPCGRLAKTIIMKRSFLFFFSLLLLRHGFSQKVVEDYSSQEGTVRYGPGEHDVRPYGQKGFTLVLPGEGHPVVGTVVDLEDYRVSGDDTARLQAFRDESLKRGFAFLTVATGVPIDWYFSDNSLVYVDAVMKDTFTKYHLPVKNVF